MIPRCTRCTSGTTRTRRCDGCRPIRAVEWGVFGARVERATAPDVVDELGAVRKLYRLGIVGERVWLDELTRLIRPRGAKLRDGVSDGGVARPRFQTAAPLHLRDEHVIQFAVRRRHHPSSPGADRGVRRTVGRKRCLRRRGKEMQLRAVGAGPGGKAGAAPRGAVAVELAVHGADAAAAALERRRWRGRVCQRRLEESAEKEENVRHY